MPELPEVETVRRDIEQHLLHQTVQHVDISERRLRTPIAPDFEDKLTHLTVASLQRRAKYILIYFQQIPQILMLHLGMSGRVAIFPSAVPLPPRHKHDHVAIRFTSGHEMRYFDPRRFGSLNFVDSIEDKFRHYGEEPLGETFNGYYLHQALKEVNSSLKAALLDQKYVVGLGNIYVCEALHQAKLHPTKKAKDLTLQQAERLTIEIKDVLSRALVAGGSTLRDHRRTNGDPGLFQHTFKVYDQAHQLCSTCHKATIERIKQAQRSTFFCSNCQK